MQNQSKKLPNILAISGSLRARSSNNAVIVVAEHLIKERANLILYNGLGSLPHFDDNQHPPEEVLELRKLIRESDGVLICSPEYAFGVPGSMKNALDWTVSSGEFMNKPVALITAATGGEKAHESMLYTLGATSAKVAPGGSLLISFIRSKMNDHGEIVNMSTKDEIESVANALVDAIVAPKQSTPANI